MNRELFIAANEQVLHTLEDLDAALQVLSAMILDAQKNDGPHGGVTLKFYPCNRENGKGCVACPHPRFYAHRLRTLRHPTPERKAIVISRKIEHPTKLHRARENPELMKALTLAQNLIQRRKSFFTKFRTLRKVSGPMRRFLDEILE